MFDIQKLLEQLAHLLILKSTLNAFYLPEIGREVSIEKIDNIIQKIFNKHQGGFTLLC